MIGSSRSYAIGMAHFQIAGGFKSLLIVCGVYLMLFFSAVGLFMFFDRTTSSHIGFGPVIVSMLIAIEAIVLIVGGSFRVASSIRTDVSSRMIESHRLMPIPSWRAVAGYIVGATTHPLAFAFLNLVLAYVFALITGASLEGLTLNQSLLFIFSVLIWTLTALGTLIFRHMYFVALAGLVVGGCLLPAAYAGLPGLAILTGPMIGDSFLSFTHSLHVSEWAYPISIAGQFIFIALLFAGACRRYRGTYPTTFSGLQAILVLVAWCGISAAGMAMWEKFHFLAGDADSFDDAHHWIYQTIASVAAAMILCLVPLRTITTDDPRKRTPLWVALGYVFLCALAMGSIALSSNPAAGMAGRAIGVTGLIVTAHAFTVFLLLKLFRKLSSGMALLVIGGILLVYWVMPLILELILSLLAARGGDDYHFSFAVTLSPLGLLSTTWMTEPDMPSPITGLVVQWLVVGILAVIAGMRSRRRSAMSRPGFPVVRAGVIAAPVTSGEAGARSS